MADDNVIMPENATLIVALREDKDGAVFEMVYKYYYRSLYTYACRYVKKEEAEEIVQTTMMWLWESREALIPELSLKSLLFTIVKNKSLDKISHNKRTQKIYDVLLEKAYDRFDDPDSYMVEELLSLFTAAIEKLPVNYRKYFEMSRIDGKTHHEIAEELKVSHQTVNYNISQALKILKTELRDYMMLLMMLVGGVD